MDDSLRTRAEQLASEIAGQARTAEDLNGLMRLMMKSALERMLDSEMDVHLGRKAVSPGGEPRAVPSNGAEPPLASLAKRSKPNRRNGRSQKTVQGDVGELTIATPRDRDGTFEPQLIGKHQRRVPGFDEKILALYAKGMTTRDIQEIVRELYDVEVSATLISEITTDLDAEVTAWRTRPLDALWPIVYFDGIVGPVARAAYFFRISRTAGASSNVNTTTSSAVVVLMSWCRLTTFTPVISSTIASIIGRAVSIRCVRTCLSRSRPLSAGRVLTNCFSAAVKTPCRRITRQSLNRWA